MHLNKILLATALVASNKLAIDAFAPVSSLVTKIDTHKNILSKSPIVPLYATVEQEKVSEQKDDQVDKAFEVDPSNILGHSIRYEI